MCLELSSADNFVNATQAWNQIQVEPTVSHRLPCPEANLVYLSILIYMGP